MQSVGVQVLSSWVGLAGDLPQGLYRCSASQMLACRPQDDDGLMLLGTQDEGQGIDLGVADAFLKVSHTMHTFNLPRFYALGLSHRPPHASPPRAPHASCSEAPKK